MRSNSLLTISTLLTTTLASTCQEISGNWYCDQTSEVVYSGLGNVPGSYQRVTDMDADTCTCTKATQEFSGPLSPLDEDLSVHFRGPIRIAQFAAYTLSSGAGTATKRKRSGVEKEAMVQRRDQQEVYTLIPPIFTEYDYQSAPSASAGVSGATTSLSPSIASIVSPDALSTTGTLIGLPSQLSSLLSSESTTPAFSSSDAPSPSTTLLPTTLSASLTSSTSPVPTSSEDSIWTRSSYYNAASGTLDNAVFQNNMGGILSGTWSSCFGNSLSYASSSGNYTSASPETLSDVLLPSDTEVILFSSTPCTSSTCGYVAPGVPGYLGFSGANKIFLFEFSMPEDEADEAGFNGDMPAIWFLNAQIPRSQQYGSCSCWPECGELDVFEILSPGSGYLTTTFHAAVGGGGGSSDYFVRPVSGYQKAAVVFLEEEEEVRVVYLDDGVEFSETLAGEVYLQWQQTQTSNVTLVY